jgi:hypothetical protein
VEAAATVAGSTEVVAGICQSVYDLTLDSETTYRSGSLADFNGKVVGGNEGSKTGRVDVLLDLECAEGGSSLGEVGRGRELGRLRVD